MSDVPTPKQLEEKWGAKRYVEARASLSTWYQKWSVPPADFTAIQILERQNSDAFELFASRMYHQIAKETLVIPEGNLVEVIKIIRAGLEYVDSGEYLTQISDKTRQNLTKWCDEEEETLSA